MMQYAQTDNNILAFSIENGYNATELEHAHQLMEQKLRQFPTLRMYVEITGLDDPETALKDLGLHMNQLEYFDRTALVTDAQQPASLVEHTDTLFACPVQGFSLTEREQAQDWISQN